MNQLIAASKEKRNTSTVKTELMRGKKEQNEWK